MKRIGSAWLLGLTLAAAAGQAVAQTGAGDYETLLTKPDFEQGIGADLLGERLDLYTGKLRFAQFDVALKGEGPELKVGRWMALGDSQFSAWMSGDFGSWNLILPMITTLASTDLEPNNRNEWIVSRLGSASAYNRCSAFNTPPSAGGGANARIWWNGLTLMNADGDTDFVVKRDASTRLPSPTAPIAGVGSFPLLTQSGWVIGCLPRTSNGEAGEGFLAVDPQGMRYWLDHIAFKEHFPFHDSDAETNSKVQRSRAMALPSRIEDRFGNALVFQYGPYGPTSITATDGRRVEIEWQRIAHDWMDHGQVSAVHVVDGAGSRTTVKYAYDAAQILTGVTRPDGSTWQFSMAENLLQPIRTVGRVGCVSETYSVPSRDFVMRAPSGLQASYVFTPTRHGYTDSPVATCKNKGLLWNWSLARSSYTGAGVDHAIDYTYEFARTIKGACGSSGCAPLKRTWEKHTDGTQKVYGFNNLYGGLEDGQLMWQEALNADGQVARRTTYAYATGDASGPYRIGASMIPLVTSGAFNQNLARFETGHVLTSRVIRQDGEEFVMRVDALDSRGRPVSKSRYSPRHLRRDAIAYHDDLQAWVLDSIASETNLDTGLVTASTTYGPKALPVSSHAFGGLTASYQFDARGNLEALVDPSGNVTLYSDWKRGIPRSTIYADSSRKTAVVDARGRIGSLGDENGFQTSFEYDQMGRLSARRPPSGDSVEWEPDLDIWQFAAGAEVGIPHAHWIRTRSTGTRRSITHFDAMSRPLLEHSFDTATPSDTHVFRRHEFDFHGNELFNSYPLAISSAGSGVRSRFDALGRTLQRAEDSELGPLVTSFSYLPGGKLQATDPRGGVVVTSFQMFDEPGYDLPLSVISPGKETVITRDVFGKPLEIKRWK